MSSSTVLSRPGSLSTPNACPFFNSEALLCQASFSSGRIPPTRIARRCFSENHEDCTLFLSKILRHSQPLHGRDPWPACQK